MPGSSPSTPESVVVLLGTETEKPGVLATVATLLAPFTGDLHVVGVGTPPRGRALAPRQTLAPKPEEVDVTVAVGDALREAGLDPARAVVSSAAARPDRALLAAVQVADPAAVILGPLQPEPTPWRSSNRLAGSVIPKVSVPMVLLRREHEHPPRRVLVATDFSRRADRALDLAVAWAGAWAGASALDGGPGGAGTRPVEVELLHISDFARPGRRSSTGIRELQIRLTARAPRASPHVLLSCRVLSAPLAPDGILAAADKWAPDLLFLGTSGHGPIGRAAFGSVARDVMERAHGSLVVVPLPR